MEKRSVAERIVDLLVDNHVDTVFGLPGGLISPIYAALTTSKIRLVTAKHEANAVLMAAGYTRQTGRLGVAIVTGGPGVTNALTGVVSAMTDRLPVLVLAGEVPRSAFGRDAAQEGSPHTFDAVAVMQKSTRLSALLVHPESAISTVRRAISIALGNEPGPVFLSLPIDVGSSPCESMTITGRARVSVEPDDAACARAFTLLREARRPLIIAGAGARRSAKRALRQLADATGAPVVTTPNGKGAFPEDDPLHLGGIGLGGHESATRYLQQGVDVAIACGTSLDDVATNAWSPLFRPTNALIHIDTDQSRFGKSYEAQLCLLGDLSDVIERMIRTAAVHEAAGAPRAERSPPGRTLDHAPMSKSTRLSTIDVMESLNELAPRDAIYVCDLGEHLTCALHCLRITEARDFISCLGFGAMGSSVPTGIGIALGGAGRRVFIICGDGGFNLSGSELATATQLSASVTVVLLNDSRLSMCHHGMLDAYGKTNDFNTQTIDFSKIGAAYGVDSEVVRTRVELARALKKPTSGTRLLDLRVDAEARLGGSQRTAALRQFMDSTSQKPEAPKAATT